jgi:DEAD/DEAH box helicase domain-containing protein
MDTQKFLDYLQGMSWYHGQIVHREDIPSREPVYAELETPLRYELQDSLEALGITRLYSHQAQAIDAVMQGENVIVSTPAASGKSLCYHLPVLETLIGDRSAKALYLFPTKALAQDQSKSLTSLIDGSYSSVRPEPVEGRVRTTRGSISSPRTGRSRTIRHEIFDGDTPTDDRPSIRRSARVVISNPDMLHMGILPNHRSWYDFLRNLRYVVLDEAHVYRGVFGSHVANVIRRLRRLCLRLGSNPQFILASATIANPGEHAEALVGLPFQVVENDGAPYGGKDFVFWNPPMIDIAEGTRRSTNTETAQVMVELMRKHIRSLAFVRSRRTAELLYVFVRDYLKEVAPTAATRIAPYRASYLPEDRREIERKLFEGRLLGLMTTTAMELGIDIGNLDATVLSGYPGSVSSTWQQSGRSGRRGERALSILVAQDNPLDQYFMRHPDNFFGRSPEAARISPTNPYVLKPQLLCAAYEAPLTAMDSDIFGTNINVEAEELQDYELLHYRNRRWHLDPEITYPSEDVNIRSTSSQFYTLVDEQSGVILETVDEGTAFMQLHPGGIYLHQGEPYLITDLDMESQTAYASTTDAPYYTEVRDRTETRILQVYNHKRAGGTAVYLGDVAVSTTVVGFRRRAQLSGEVLGEEYVEMPTQSYNTIAIWFDIPDHVLNIIRDEKLDLAGGLHACEHAAIGVLPLFALCDRNDIGGISTPIHPDTGKPQIFVHDGHPGGVGITERGYEIVEEWWQATLDVITECPCEDGCPSCVHSPKCGNNNQPLDKAVAAMILRGMLGES